MHFFMRPPTSGVINAALGIERDPASASLRAPLGQVQHLVVLVIDECDLTLAEWNFFHDDQAFYFGAGFDGKLSG
jgi:hypothetical protein